MNARTLFRTCKPLLVTPVRNFSFIARAAPSSCVRRNLFRSSQRFFSSSPISLAAHAAPEPGQASVILRTPNLEYIEQEEIDVELPPEPEVDIHITERAAEQLRGMVAKQNVPEAGLRVLVDSGGCHGYQYKYEVAKGSNPDDYHFSHPTIQPSNIYIDAITLSLINGSTIDYSTELIGSSFKVTYNPRSKGSGCGCGTSWELKA